MNFCIDVGNTTVNLGVFVGEKMVKHQIVSTASLRSDFTLFVESLRKILESNVPVKKVGIVSVVPDLEMILADILKEETGSKPLLFNLGATIPISLKVDFPEEVGADRALGSWYAYQKYSRALIVIDFGTATTFDVVSSAGEFLGGIIAPGVTISFKALLSAAARLPHEMNFGNIGPLIGKNSQGCIRAAYFQGTSAMVKGLLSMIKEERSENFLPVYTGGWLNPDLVTTLRLNGNYEPNLLLEGLNHLLQEKY